MLMFFLRMQSLRKIKFARIYISINQKYKNIIFALFYITYLVGGLEHFLFTHILGMSSSQLTSIFFRGVAQPPTSYIFDHYIPICLDVLFCVPDLAVRLGNHPEEFVSPAKYMIDITGLEPIRSDCHTYLILWFMEHSNL